MQALTTKVAKTYCQPEHTMIVVLFCCNTSSCNCKNSASHKRSVTCLVKLCPPNSSTPSNAK